jgi:tight adherence protein C
MVVDQGDHTRGGLVIDGSGLASVAAALAVVGIARGLAPRPDVRPLAADPGGGAGARVRPHTRRWVRPTVTAIGAVTAAAVFGPLLVVAAVAAGGAASRVRRLARTRAESAARARSFPDVLDLVIIAIRSGLTPRQAIEVVAGVDGPCRPALAEVVHRVQRGQPFADAVRALVELLGPWATSPVDAIATCDRYGLPLGPMLDELTNDARTVRQRIDQAAARRLPVKLSFPLVACTLPSFVLLAIVPAVIAALSSLRPPAW